MQPIAGLASPTQHAHSSPEMDATKAYLARYEVDRRSIFVGNLPLRTTEQQLRDLFEHYGEIQEVSLRENVSKFEREL
jgi:RNA recognition motif-containing protein